MKWLYRLVFLGILALPQVAFADAGLQLNPLRYDDTFTTTSARQGFITVSNPSDVSVTIVTKVQGFRQVDLDGSLQFFDDPQLSAGIIPGLPSFDLGPRESINVAFTVDPIKLPQGGIYAAIFFKTQPPAGNSKSTYLVESANVGTLLLLQNGQIGQKTGRIQSLKIPFWQFGNTVHGTILYENTNRNAFAPAFTPNLSAKVGYIAHNKPVLGNLVMPSNTRKISLKQSGSYFGLLPLSVHAAESGDSSTTLIFACTGWCQYVALVILGATILAFIELFRRKYMPKKMRK